MSAVNGVKQLMPGIQSREPIKWPDEVESLVDRLKSESARRALRSEERALTDFYASVPVLRSDEGLHGFGQSGLNHQGELAVIPCKITFQGSC